MKTRPKGYRASARAGALLVTGSLIDFTAEEESGETKISILKSELKVSDGSLSAWQDM